MLLLRLGWQGAGEKREKGRGQRRCANQNGSESAFRHAKLMKSTEFQSVKALLHSEMLEMR